MNTAKKGQALLELSIFGSILIMLLGVLVNYGMKYNFQQQVMQQAFRKALGIAAKQRSGNYLLLRDGYIPNPEDPFTTGSVTPVIAQASVIRDYRMHETAEKASELPHMYINLPGNFRRYETAAFRDESDVPASQLYDEGGYDCDGNGKVDKDEEGRSKYDCVYGSEGIGWWPTSGEEGDSTRNIRIIDNCAGEIIDYEAMKRRCRKISQAGIRTPWYCSQINNIFEVENDEPTVNMGLQPDESQVTSVNNSLRKEETSSHIKTTDNFSVQITTPRTVIYNNAVNAQGVSTGTANVREDTIETKASNKISTQTWETPF